MKRTRLKKKVTSVTKADSLFSKWVRERDGKCVRCGKTTNLQASHFWPRAWSSTRFDPENVDSLCYGCHYGNIQGWERAKQGEYRQFKINQLGVKAYADLEKRANSKMKQKDSIAQFMAWYEKL